MLVHESGMIIYTISLISPRFVQALPLQCSKPVITKKYV